MKLFKLYQLVKTNQKLAAKRHPMLDKNKAMKVYMWIILLFWIGYLIMFGFLFGNIFKDHPTYNDINGGLLIFLILDFFLRFIAQDTPAHEIKPYKLLPIKEKSLLQIFLIRMGLKPYNIFWWCFFIPFGLLTIPFSANGYGMSGLLMYLIYVWLLFVLNAYWYLLWRPFINYSIWWVLAPIAIYAAMLFFGFINDNFLFMFSKHQVHDVVCFNFLPMLWVLIGIVVLFMANLYFQGKFMFYEIAKVEKIKKITSREYSFLNRFGEIGEYLKLEIKSIQRNKTVKKQFSSGVICTLMLCCIFAFTGAYDNSVFMKVFICMYCFACLGVITLTGVMCPEGNYIDCLMSHRESILSLLKAKYYFNLGLMIIPLLIIIMPIIQGKTSWIEALSCMFFSAGVIMPFVFQLAVYNNATLKLNEKLTASGQSNKNQMIISLVALFVPMFLMYFCINMLGTNIGSLVMLVLGVIGVALHPWWLRNIYERFMKRRYENMSNFRATR